MENGSFIIVSNKQTIKTKKKKSYVIVDEHNRWQSMGYNATQKEIDKDIEEIRERLKEEGEDHVELILFEIKGKPITV